MSTLLQPPTIPDNAPFSPEQIAWLNGFLAGAYSSGSGQAISEPSTPAIPVTILWGSQTGNSEAVAKQLGKKLSSSGCEPTVVDMGDYDCSSLANEENVLIVTSTYGEGEPPDNAAELYEWILSDAAPRLEKLSFSVLALGDSNYPDFCKCGIDFDLRLEALGAKRISARVDCDVDFDEAFESWAGAVTAALDTQEERSGISETEVRKSTEPVFGKKNPFPASVVENRNLNGADSAKETRHVALSIEGSGFSYEPGDALAIVPRNCEMYTASLIEALGFSATDTVAIPEVGDMPLAEALLNRFDITNLSPKVVNAIGAVSANEGVSSLGADRDALKEFAWGRQLIDLIEQFKPALTSGQEFIACLPKLAPRLYSISSSPKRHPGEVHVTVGAVCYESNGKERKGVCSNYLAEHEGDSLVSVFFHATKTFKLPENDDLPVVMVGPGTGIAPFRAFLEEREARGAKGKNWLFFGDQKASSDFLYKEEIEEWFRSGVLNRFDTAFSRDQAEKIYVQDRMREHGAELFAWLEEGGYFYVCGDASRMAKDVDTALRDVIAEHGGVGVDEAEEYVAKLKKGKKYLRDVY